MLGGLKVGKKRLYMYHGAALQEITPDCVLDFYVHESCQRLGVGRLLLDVRPTPIHSALPLFLTPWDHCMCRKICMYSQSVGARRVRDGNCTVMYMMVRTRNNFFG